MCDAEWIEDAGLHRHLAADLIGGLRRDDEADIASDLHCGSPKAWAALHHFIAGKKRAAQVFHLRRCFGPASADVLAYQRSEEHTSELQSLMRISYAVFCLKKKNHTITNNPHTQ